MPAIDDLPQLFATLLMGFGLLFVVIFFAGTMADQVDTGGKGVVNSNTEKRFNITNGEARLHRDTVKNVQVFDSRGNGVSFGDDGGNVSGNFSAAVDNGGAVTVSAWVKLNQSASVGNDYHVVTLGDPANASIQFLDGNWSVYYDNGTASARLTNVSSTPKAWTQIGFRSNGTHLELVRNGSVVNETVLSTGQSASIQNANGLHGRLDELREFDEAVSDATLTELYADPIRGQEGTRRTARLMFEESSGLTTFVVFDSVDATLQGAASFDAGLARSTVPRPGNYTLKDGEVLNVVDGSWLDDAPIAYVSYDVKDDTEYEASAESTGDALESVSDMFTALAIVVLAALALGYFKKVT